MSEFTDDLKHIARFDTPRDPRKACLEAADRIEALEAALRAVMIGGNHVALLIGADHPPYTAACDEALAHYGPGDAYEAWNCWMTIMEARNVLYPTPSRSNI